MASNTLSDPSIEKTAHNHGADVVSVDEKRGASNDNQIEHVITNDGNLHYDEADEEPEIHMRTYIALFSMFMLNLVQVVALQGPPAVVSIRIMVADNDRELTITSLAISGKVLITPKDRHGFQILYPSSRPS